MFGLKDTVDGSEIRLTSCYGKYPIIYFVLALSQVVVWDFFHQEYVSSDISCVLGAI